MSFIWPSALLFLATLPLFVLLYLGAQRRRKQLIARYGDLGFAPVAADRRSGFRRHIPPLIFLAALALSLLALSRPQMVVSLPHVERTMMLAFDVSGSMAADDITPTRMEAAKSAAQTFVQNQPANVLIGVIAFSDSGLTVQQPTNDREAVLATIKRLAPERGTSLANGIYAALDALSSNDERSASLYSDLPPTPAVTPTSMPAGVYLPAAIILFTDGENTVSPDPLEAAQEAARRGVRIYTVGIGSSAGASLEVEGFLIHTQLDEAMLQQIAVLSAGEYYRASGTEDLSVISQKIDPQFSVKPEKMEVTSTLAGLSILMMFIAGTFSLAWFRRLP